jgi:hypothetical protein
MGTKNFESMELSGLAKNVYLSLPLSFAVCTVARPKRGIEYMNCAENGWVK